MAKNTSFSYVPDAGWTGRGFEIAHAPVEASEVKLVLNPRGGEPTPVAITSVTAVDNKKLSIQAEDFNYRGNWTLTIGGDTYTRADMDDEQVEGLEVYAAKKEGDLIYRLYTPNAKGPRPLLLFLHGGGNGGTDNITHIAADYGTIQFAQKYPDFYVLAPQAPQPERGPGGPGGPLGAGVPMHRMNFANSDQTGKMGWHREYLASVCDFIRKMIADGKVDRRRVYVTGMSMGGAGTLRAMSVGAGLFAAAVPVCPSMTPETYNILRGLTNAKVWIATAYLDHTPYRHKYIVDGIMALREAGNKNAHLTLYSPEELEAYGIATDPTMSLEAKASANHATWVPTYHDEHGIMSWLTEQTLSL